MLKLFQWSPRKFFVFFFIQTIQKQIYVANKLLCRNCLRKTLLQRSYLITKCNQKIFRSLAVVTCDRDRILLLFLMLIISIIILVITTHSIKIATDTLHIPSIIAFLTSSSLKKMHLCLQCSCTEYLVTPDVKPLYDKTWFTIYKITRVIYDYAKPHWLQRKWTYPMKV